MHGECLILTMPPRGPLVRFLGTGTPIGQRGLHQACILVETADHKLLIDCGMTALASLGRIGVDPGEIDAVAISHLHGDHFGGLAPLLLDATLRPRARPLTIAGPAATRSRVEQALEVFGWTTSRLDVADFVELVPGVPRSICGCEVTAFAVLHNPATSPTGLRITVNGVAIGYSGDAGWSDALIEIARDADLFICGAWSFDTADDSFLDVATLLRNRNRLSCRRLVLTHVGPTALERQAELPLEVVTDGAVIQL
jgi:ribonuclease BN (tRNA processing enzyme)